MRLMTGMLGASNYPALAQPGDVAVAIAEFMQDGVGMFARLGARRPEPARRPAQRDCLPDQLQSPEPGVIDWLGDAEMAHLRIGEYLIDRVDRSRRYAGLVEPLDPFRAVARDGDRLDSGVERLPVLRAQPTRNVIRMVGHFRCIER